MELIDPATGETFECPQGWPSEKRRKRLADANEKRNDAAAVLAVEYKDAHEVNQLETAERVRVLQAEPKLAARLVAYSNRVQDVHYRCTRAMCQATLDTRTLTAERRALIESNIDADFWTEQSVPAMEDAVERFQLAYKRGQRGDRTNPPVESDAVAAVESGAPADHEAAIGVGEGSDA